MLQIMSDAPIEWLSADQQRIWRAWLLGKARIDNFLDAELRKFGLDLGEYEILVTLSEFPDREMRMSDLAESVHQSRSRLTHTIGRMERAGLVERRDAREDRRGRFARLTDQGYALLAEAAPSHVQAVRHVFVDPVDPADFQALGRAMRAVLEMADSKGDTRDLVGPFDLPAD